MTPRRLIEPARLAGTSMLRTQSDARLVDLVRAGHASAFEAIVQRYRKPLLSYCSRLLPASRAEDAVQQTFLKAYQAMVAGDAELKLRPWLYRIAHNSSLNLLRQNGWSHEELDENMDGVQRPEQALELRERLRSTVAAVKALPERQRDAVLLRELEGLSYEEIALALGVGDGAVRQLLHRARSTLRAGLTAVTPVGLTERLAAAIASGGADPTARVAELTGGIGLGAGAVKLGAAVLATGVIATGAATGPLRHHSRHSTAADEASLTPSSGGKTTRPAAPQTMPVEDHAPAVRHETSHHRGRGSHGGSGSNSHSHGGGHHGASPRSGSGGYDGGSDVHRRGEHHSGSGDDGSGSGGGGDRNSGSDDGTSGSGSGGSGGDSHSGGTDDSLSTLSGEDRSGSGGGGGGGGDSGSGDSSGSDDHETLTAPMGTTGSTGPITDDSGKDGSHSGSGSGSGGD